MNELDPQVLKWLVALCEAINEVGATLDVPYGDFHLGDMEVRFDGDITSFSVGMSEHGSNFAVLVKND